MNLSRLTFCAILLVPLPAITAHSQLEEHDLSPRDRWLQGQSVFTVAIAPQNLTTQYFSAESLRESLPRLWPAHIMADWCKGKEKQHGVVVLKNTDVVFWHSCAADFIVFEGDKYPGSFGFKESDPTFSTGE
ncbi:MAG: hypothetical protein OEU36_18485 [Gammaproteobacteria bacterium]|nr:hypothetical protein [Gammaproteobacteria bacterium]